MAKKQIKAPTVTGELKQALQSVGIADKEIAAINRKAPVVTGAFAKDTAAHKPYWAAVETVQRQLGGAVTQDKARAAAVLQFRDFVCDAREAYLDAHVEAVYGKLTANRSKFVRVDELLLNAGDAIKGLTPTRKDIAAEEGIKQGDKPGLQVAQGQLLSKILGNRTTGDHLCHAMLLPLEGSAEALAKFRRDGALELDYARLERRGKAVVMTHTYPATLNAEDDGSLEATETAIDVATLDPDSTICVLRGGTVDHRKYPGKRLFGAGINLTHLYWGRISYFFYVVRDLGLVNKFYRGVARPDRDPSEVTGGTREKLWIGAIEGFAIGGACQIVLTMDYNIAETGAYMTLPARKEGIIPGAANLRLPRFVGDRIARQAIMYERRIDADSPEGRMICDEVVPEGGVDQAVDNVIERLTTSGVVSAAGNRRSIRVGEEPLDLFRQYMAVYAREQAFCHFSPALIGNLERYWNAQNRTAA